MLVKALIYIGLILNTNAIANELSGNYRAVTESEFQLLINLNSNKTGEFITGVYAVEEDDKEWRKTQKIKWAANKEYLFIEIEPSDYIKYKLVNCLSYSEFGYKGCSFGLKPISGSFSKGDSVLRNSLWKTKEIKKLW